MAKLHINLLNQINTRYYKYIIIINCHHDDFWKKIKLLTNFKIINRKQFIVSNYFITVTLLEYKHDIPTYISLGNTCGLAFQLKETGLRTQTFPFDWCKITINQLNKVLYNNFNKFNKLEVLKYSNNHDSYLLKNPYNITFAHELYQINDYQINQLENIINERIINFINLKNKHIRFIIHKSFFDSIELNKLIKNLQKYFTNFKIFYITDIHSIINKYNSKLFNLETIKVISIDYNMINWDNWHLSDIDWFDLLFKRVLNN